MSYKYLAQFYDFFVEAEPVEPFAGFIKSAVKKYHPSTRSILEMGSGTGNVLIRLSKDFETFGIDASGEMVKLAKQKDKKTKYFVQDMRELNFKRKFGAIVSMFDTVNHLIRWSEWQKTFTKVFSHLENGGLFIFDIHTVYKLKQIAKYEFYIVEDKKKNVIALQKVLDKNVLHWQFKFFIKLNQNKYQLFEETIDEAAFPLLKIKNTLQKTGFKILQLSELDYSSISRKTQRAFFICQKP